MEEKISIESLKVVMRSEEEYALIDVREPMEYDRKHVFRANNLQRSLLEFRISELVPLRHTKIILCDDNGQRAFLSAETLEKNGFSNVACIDGGINAWEKAGNIVVKGTNVHSKAFGEKVAKDYKVPQITPEDLKAWREKGEDVIVIEVRPHGEVERTGSIPGAINIPGVELPIRVFDYSASHKRIVVTCAGRTRGIMAAQTLRLMGIRDVYDLKGGTMAWILAGLKLDKEILRGSAPSEKSIRKAESFAKKLAMEGNIHLLTCEGLRALLDKAQKETVYLLDVRSVEEYSAGHLPNSIPAPGGQAIQIADSFVAVRNGNIVFISEENARAIVTAFWYKQMGYPKVFVLDGGVNAWSGAGMKIEVERRRLAPLGIEEATKRVRKIGAANLKKKLEENKNIAVVDVDLSRYFEQGHVPGAHWISRGWLEFRIKGLIPNEKAPVVVTCQNSLNSTLAGKTLMAMGYTDISVLEGGTAAWKSAGFFLEKGLTGIEGKPDDIWIPPYERGRAEMLEYLDWEEKLIEMGGKLK